MEKLDCAVIGAGVVGLAAARELVRAHRDVVVLERTGQIGSEVSSRNSEVIHAGIYYPPGSLKARYCVAGKQLLYQYCAARSVLSHRVGKLVVACDAAEVHRLHEIKVRAEQNGVHDLMPMSGGEARELEPALHCEAALYSPSTGILDTHGFMLALQGDVEADGGMIAFNAPVVSGRITTDGILLRVGGDAPMELLCKTVVNAAGLGAIALAASIEGFPPHCLPPAFLAKGRYLSLAGPSPFARLIYPLPSRGGLGIHLTLDLGGQARFGPDVEWVDDIDYSVPTDLADRFADSIKRFWPDIEGSQLRPAYSGIRPKLHGPDSTFADFAIDGAETHGAPGLINLFGIESPGFTSSLAIAARIVEMIGAEDE